MVYRRLKLTEIPAKKTETQWALKSPGKSY